MNIRWWPHTYDQRIASARLRSTRVVDALVESGIDAAVWRLGDPTPDVMVLSKRYDRDSLAVARSMRSAGCKLVLDLCDNHFHHDKPNDDWTQRIADLRQAIALVDLVVAATPALQDAIHIECGSSTPVRVIGDAVETPLEPCRFLADPFAWLQLQQLRHRIAQLKQAGGVALIWFGNRGSSNAEGGMRDLLRIVEPLRRLGEHCSVMLTVVSNSAAMFRSIAPSIPVPSFYIGWRQSSFSDVARQHDIALIPVSINPFTRCKSNNRVASSLLHELAVCADPVPSYLEFNDCIVMDDWQNGLLRLCNSDSLRRAMVAEGQRRVLSKWSLPAIADQWQQTLQQVLSMPSRPGIDRRPDVPEVTTER